MAKNKKKKPSLLMAIFVIISSLTLASIAAYISVSGLAKIFPVSASIFLFAALEGSKLVTASLLHNQWKRLNKALRTYLTIAVIALIFITSAGLYAFLSSAYSKTATQIEIAQKQNDLDDITKKDLEGKIANWEDFIDTKNERIRTLTEQRSQQETRLDSLLNRRYWNSVKRTEQLIADSNADIDELNAEIDSLSVLKSNAQQGIYDLETGKMVREQEQADTDVLTFIYISELTGLPIETVINILVIILVFIFDPLAVLLLVSFNGLMKQRREGDEEKLEIISSNSDIEKVTVRVSPEQAEKITDAVSDDNIEVDVVVTENEDFNDPHFPTKEPIMEEKKITVKTATGEYPFQNNHKLVTSTGEYTIGDLTDEERDLLFSTLKAKREADEEIRVKKKEEEARLKAEEEERRRVDEEERLKREEEIRKQFEEEERERKEREEQDRLEAEKRAKEEEERREQERINAEIKKEEERMENEEKEILSNLEHHRDLFMQLLEVLYDGGNKKKGGRFEPYPLLKANIENAGIEVTEKQFDDFLTVCALLRIIQVHGTSEEVKNRILLKDYMRAKVLLTALSS